MLRLNLKKEDNNREIDFPLILGKILEKEPDPKKQAENGVEMEINGEKCLVKHLELGPGAYIRIFPENKETMRLISIEDIFDFPENEDEKPPLDSSGFYKGFDRTFNLDKETKEAHLTLNGLPAGIVMDVLNDICSLCDFFNDIKSYHIHWNGDLSSLLPESLTNPLFEYVRFINPNQLVIYNYNFTRNNNDPCQTQREEKQNTVPLQRGILQEEGIIGEHDKEHIKITVHDPDLRNYIYNINTITGFDPNHPLSRELLDVFISLYTQIKCVRESLSHLCEIKDGEIINIMLSDKPRNPQSGAEYFFSGTTRSGVSKRPLENFIDHAVCAFYKDTTDFTPGSLIELNEKSITAELRHHIHSLAAGPENIRFAFNNGYTAYSAVTETIDGLRSLGPILNDIRSNNILHDIGPEKFETQIAGFLSVFDAQKVKGFRSGHIFSWPALREFARALYRIKPDITEEEIREIDARLFRFLSNADFEGELDKKIRKLLRPLERLHSMEESGQNESVLRYLQNMEIDIIKSYSGSTENFKPAELIEFYRLLEKCKKMCEQYIKGQIETDEQYADTDSPEKAMAHIAIKVVKQMRFVGTVKKDFEKLKKMILKYCPYIAPDGGKYVSYLDYLLSPETLLKAAS